MRMIQLKRKIWQKQPGWYSLHVKSETKTTRMIQLTFKSDKNNQDDTDYTQHVKSKTWQVARKIWNKNNQDDTAYT